MSAAHLTVLPSPTERFTAPAVQCAAFPVVVEDEQNGHCALRDLAPEHDPEYSKLSAAAKDKFLVKRSAMQVIDRAHNKTAVAKMLESQLAPQMGRGFSAKRLINDYYAWTAGSRDWRLLVDAALAPGFRHIKRSRGLDATPAGDGSVVPAVTAEWWITLAESYQRNAEAGWREAKRLWIQSWADPETRIPGYGSARDYWSRTNPFALSQTTCPPDFPKGWTRTTFYSKMPPRWESANARVGAAYARGLLPGVPATRAGARYMEWVFFDDKRHDFYSVVNGVLTPCLMLELGALDYATGEYIVWGYRPELPGADDTKIRLKEQDMKWLVAALLQQEGYPRDYDCHLVCEMGTAILRAGPAKALFDLTGGRVKTCYTEMQGETWLIWEEKKKGNSRGKAPLESLHNYLKNETAHLPGQTGVTHERQPATLPAQLRETRNLLALGELMQPEEQKLIQHSLLRYEEATKLLDAIYRRANERSVHSLEGIERDVVGWRFSEAHPWTWTRDLPAEVQALRHVPGFEVSARKPSPLELKHRLKEGHVFVQLPEWAWPLFFDHTQKAGRIDKLEFGFTQDGKDYVFWPDDNDPGQLSAAKAMEMKGEKLLGYYNPRKADCIYLTRENGAYFATWRRIQRASRGDREAHAALRERVERRVKFARRGALARHGEAAAAQLERSFANGATLERAGVIPPATRPAGPAGPAGPALPAEELAKVITADDHKRAQKQALIRRPAGAAVRRAKDYLPAADDDQSAAACATTHPGSKQEAPIAEDDEGLWMCEPDPTDSDTPND